MYILCVYAKSNNAGCDLYRNEDGYPFIQHGNKTSDTRYLGDCAETDWLSSSGNSCEEDAQER